MSEIHNPLVKYEGWLEPRPSAHASEIEYMELANVDIENAYAESLDALHGAARAINDGHKDAEHYEESADGFIRGRLSSLYRKYDQYVDEYSVGEDGDIIGAFLLQSASAFASEMKVDSWESIEIHKESSAQLKLERRLLREVRAHNTTKLLV